MKAHDGTVIVKGTISDNTATDQGGGIHNRDGGTITFEANNLIESNTAAINGGGIYNMAGATITGTREYGSGNTPNNCVGVGCP